MAQPAKRHCWECDPEKADFLVESKVEKYTRSFIWTIDEYANVSQLDEFSSPIFTGGPNNKHSWQLTIEPKRSLREAHPSLIRTNYFSVYLNLVEFGGEGAVDDGAEVAEVFVRAAFQVNILDAHGRASLQTQEFNEKRNDTCHYFSNLDDESRGGWERFMLSSDVEKLVIDNKLKIHCKVVILGEPNHCVEDVSWYSPSFEEKYNSLKERLSTDFGKIYRESIMTDIVISTGASTYNVHKAVLAARSSVFAAMFSLDMKEKEMNTVTITDFEDEVVKGMLDHIYTGQAESMEERAPELLEIAEKYILAGLKEDCECVIARKLNLENSAQILTLAHNQNAQNLKVSAIKFINRNKEELMKNKPFLDAVKADSDTGTGAFSELNFLKN